MPSFLVYFVSI